MDAVRTWVTPHIFEELVSSTDVPFTIDLSRHKLVQTFCAALTRITTGKVSQDDSIIVNLADAVWNAATKANARIVSDVVSLALSHGYRRTWRNCFEGYAESNRSWMLDRIGISEAHEKHFEFYLEIIDDLEHSNIDSGWFVLTLCEIGIVKLADKIRESKLLYLEHVSRIAVDKYTPGNEKLKRLIIACISVGNITISQADRLIETKDFDDALLDSMGTWHQDDKERLYTCAIVSDREDLAEKIAQML